MLSSEGGDALMVGVYVCAGDELCYERVHVYVRMSACKHTYNDAQMITRTTVRTRAHAYTRMYMRAKTHAHNHMCGIHLRINTHTPMHAHIPYTQRYVTSKAIQQEQQLRQVLQQLGPCAYVLGPAIPCVGVRACGSVLVCERKREE